MSQSEIELSVVIPIYDEEENIPELYRRLHQTLSTLDRSYEIIAIDDGSRDNSFSILKELAEQDPHLRVVRFRRNFGQSAAFAAGFDLARGQVIITMDADLQNDPADIPRLLETMEQGDYDIVSGWRKDRKDPFLTRRLPSQIANRLISWATDIHLHDYGCSLKAYRAEVIKQVHLYGELHRFIPALASWIGVRVAEIPVQHHPRMHGRSKYGLGRVFRVLLDLITVRFLLSYSARPMQLFGGLGLISAGIGFLIGLYLTALKLFFGEQLSTRPLLWLAILMVIIGMQLITMGLLGELIIRTYHETQNKPIYAIREIIETAQDEEKQ